MRDFLVTDENTGVEFTPFTDAEKGIVGVRAEHPSGLVEYVYFCPSTGVAGGPDGEIPSGTVFVYIGAEADPAQDGAVHFYDLLGTESR